MTYNSVAEIYEALEQTRGRLRQTLEGLSAETAGFRESPERWTIAEIVEHLALVEGGVARVAAKMVGKVEAESGKGEAEGGRAASESGGVEAGNGDGARAVAARPIAPVELDAIIERATREKFTAPQMAHPTGGPAIADSLARLEESSAALRALRPRVETLDLSGQRFPHPAFGPLDLYQWLAVLSLHEERHRRQIEAIKSAQAVGATDGV